MIGEVVKKLLDVAYAGDAEKSGHNGEDDTGVPFVFFDEPTEESAWKSEEGDDEPEFVVTE